jgi:hypothetical protein
MASGIVDRLKRALQSLALVSVPDHPASGGNTGDAEWPRDEEATPDEDSDDTVDSE